MSKTLLLTSQGLPDELKDVFLSLLTKHPKDIKVSFITTAAYGEEGDISWLEIYRKQLQSYGITQIEDLDLKDKKKNQLQTILSDKDIIFVNGGNTFYLLKHARISGFLQLLPHLLNEGKLYVGISAGSILMGPSIELAGWEPSPDRNYIKLQDLSSIGIVPLAIMPHFKREDKLFLDKNAQTVSYPVIALNDTQAVLVKDNIYRIVGKGERLIFNQPKIKIY